MLPELFKRLKPLFGKLIDFVWIEYQTATPERKIEIEEILTFFAVKTLGVTVGEERIILEPPLQENISQGNYYIGKVIYPAIKPYPFCIYREELLRHIFILGPTGSGKSTLILNFLWQFLMDKTPFMIFDFKRNYRSLLRAWTTYGEELIAFTVGKKTAPLTMNALQPPSGVEREVWVEALADIISSAYLLMQGARNVLKDAFHEAFKERQEKATLKDALYFLELEIKRCRGGSRRYGWLESAVRSLEELCHGGFGESLNAERGMKIEDLLSVPVVFELESLGEDQRRFFCLYFLQAIFLSRKQSSEKRDLLRHLLVFDESHNIFLREKIGGGLQMPSRLAREIREYGEAIMAASQQSDVSESLIANAGFKFVLRCDYPRDVMFASRLMNMDTKWFPKIPMGYGIARLPVRHLTPFLFKFDKQKIKEQNVPDEEVRERWKKHPLQKNRENEKEEKEKKKIELSDREFTLLLDVVDHPISTITERYRRLKWNYKRGNITKDKLLAHETARFRNIKTLTGWIKILYLTRKGRECLKEKGIDVNRVIYGGPEHEYWKHQVKKRLESLSCKVKEEYPITGGKRVDLYAIKNKKIYFVEIETGNSNIQANIDKCKKLKGETILFFTTPKLRKEYQELEKQGVLLLDPTTMERLAEFIT